MKIKKGQLLNVRHNRSGNWKGIATKDFDTEKEEWYPIALAQKKDVHGLSTIWEEGDNMPCRNSFCKVDLIK